MPEEPLLEPYLTRTDIDDPPLRPRRGARASSASATGRSRLETSYTARHQLDNTLAALDRLRRARHPARGRDARGRVLAAARGGDRARRRRAADQRLLQREPALDARGARAPRRARRRRAGAVAVLGEMAELGDGRAGLPPRGRRGRRASRRRRAVAVGPLAREYAAGANGVATHDGRRPPPRRPTRSRELLRPGRRRARQGLARGGTRSGRGETDAARWHASSSRRSSR